MARLILALFLLSAPAFSQSRDLTLFAGIQHPGRITLNNATSTGTSGVSQIITDPGDFGTFGIRLGHGKVFGGEHSLAFSSSFIDSHSRSFLYNSNIRVQAPLPVVQPYVTAGLGTVITWGSGASDIGSKFALNYGGGVKLMYGERIGFRADVRGYSLPKVQSQTLNIAEVSVGVVFGF